MRRPPTIVLAFLAGAVCAQVLGAACNECPPHVALEAGIYVPAAAPLQGDAGLGSAIESDYQVRIVDGLQYLTETYTRDNRRYKVQYVMERWR